MELSRPRNLPLSQEHPVNLRLVDWIWNITGSLPLAPGQSSGEAFGKLDPLFRERGTSHDRANDTLTFRKENQAPQDAMAIFDGGVLQVEKGAGGSVLHYRLTSKFLLFCFILPFVFLAFAQFTVAIGKLEKPATEAAAKKPEKEETVKPQNPIDKFLGAPAPEKPKKDADKDKDKNSPTTAYVLAAIFAALYLVGRILEDRLIKAQFKKRLLGP